MLSVADEITHSLFPNGCRPVSESCVLKFVSEIAEGVFVLSNNQREPRHLSSADDLEIVDYAHELTHVKEH